MMSSSPSSSSFSSLSLSSSKTLMTRKIAAWGTMCSLSSFLFFSPLLLQSTIPRAWCFVVNNENVGRGNSCGRSCGGCLPFLEARGGSRVGSEKIPFVSERMRRTTTTTRGTRTLGTSLRAESGKAAGDDKDEVFVDAEIVDRDKKLKNEDKGSGDAVDAEIVDKKEAVGNLVADDEWLGLSMELSEIVRTAVVEDIKTKTRGFIDKDEYKIGDISKEIDSRIKDGVASMRNKEEYELGDLVLAMDEVSKNYTETLTGKPYEPGDLSIELDRRVKTWAAGYAGKETYEFGDLSRAVAARVSDRVEEFTGKSEYEFGDVTREVNRRRKEWIKDYLGEEAAKNYQFGDITKKVVTDFTGKDKYEFGDISKKIFGDFFKPRKRGGTSQSSDDANNKDRDK